MRTAWAVAGEWRWTPRGMGSGPRAVTGATAIVHALTAISQFIATQSTSLWRAIE